MLDEFIFSAKHLKFVSLYINTNNNICIGLFWQNCLPFLSLRLARFMFAMGIAHFLLVFLYSFGGAIKKSDAPDQIRDRLFSFSSVMVAAAFIKGSSCFPVFLRSTVRPDVPSQYTFVRFSSPLWHTDERNRFDWRPRFVFECLDNNTFIVVSRSLFSRARTYIPKIPYIYTPRIDFFRHICQKVSIIYTYVYRWKDPNNANGRILFDERGSFPSD